MSKLNWDKPKRRELAREGYRPGRVARADIDARQGERHSADMTTVWHPSARPGRSPRAAAAFEPGDEVAVDKRYWGTVIDSNLQTTAIYIGNNRKLIAATKLCQAT